MLPTHHRRDMVRCVDLDNPLPKAVVRQREGRAVATILVHLLDSALPQGAPFCEHLGVAHDDHRVLRTAKGHDDAVFNPRKADFSFPVEVQG